MSTPPTRLLLALTLLAGHSAAADFPFAAGTFDASGNLKPWTLQDVREYSDTAIGDLTGKKSVAEKDHAATPNYLAYKSDAVETKKFTTVLNLTAIAGSVFLAIQVDDRATLTVAEAAAPGAPAGQPPFSQTYQVNGTALWKKDASYREFPTPIPGGRTYHLTLTYQNRANLLRVLARWRGCQPGSRPA